jgi:hypothetical protein
MTTPQVAVLFARRDSIYKSFPNCDVWDEDRDARKWPGGLPIVAHPPCRAWGVLKAMAKPLPHEKALAPWSIKQIRRWGGVLEHPLGSDLWPHLKLPPPGGLQDEFGGWTLKVDQFHYGHKARKRTLLYICGIQPSELPRKKWKPGEPQFVVAQNKTIRAQSDKHKPSISKEEREETPEPFAKWLCEIAQKCRQPRIMINV